AKPDILCITGDFVAGSVSMAYLVPFLMELSHGVRTFGVLGNHDHGDEVNTPALAATLRRAGVELLINEAHRVQVRGVTIHVVGVDDPHTDRADLAAALEHTPRGPGSFVL